MSNGKKRSVIYLYATLLASKKTEAERRETLEEFAEIFGGDIIGWAGLLRMALREQRCGAAMRAVDEFCADRLSAPCKCMPLGA